MENKICLDTDFLIDLLNNKKYAADFIKETEKKFEIGVSIVTIFELYHGAYLHKNAKQLDLIDKLCSGLSVINLTNEIVKESGKISALLEKTGKALEFKDIFIGVSAKMTNHDLKTNNIKHFKRIEGLKVI